MTKVAAVILVGNVAEAERQARMAFGKGADLVELRLDGIDGLRTETVRHLARALGERAIATLRSQSQGGESRESRAGRGSLMREICGQRFAYVDLELEADAEGLDALARAASRYGTKVIVSHHFAEAVDVHRVSNAIDACEAHGDVAKVVLPVNDLDGAIQLVDLARSRAAGHPHTLIGTGAGGMLTRALAGAMGAEIQFAAWGRAATPGQFGLSTAARLRGREPIVLGLVGHPLEHSISPVIQEPALAALDLPAVYLPFDLSPGSLEAFWLAMDRLRIRGFNVTHPHKESVAQRVDEMDADAERLGAVNTVVVDDGWTNGHNTDVYGFRVSLRALGLRVGGRSALVVGAGGAAKAVVHVLLREGASVQVTNRTIARADALADSFDEPVAVVPMKDLERSGPWDLIVNAIATGRGVTFGLALRASATVERRPDAFGVRVDVADGVDPALALGAARMILHRNGVGAGLAISIDSEIPISRGLKSSSAVANAVVLASARALEVELEPLEMIRIGVRAATEAGVTLTGAFDDACASFFGGIVSTDNRSDTILRRDRFPDDLIAVVEVPARKIPKASLKGLDFVSIRPQVEAAFRLAERGDYFRAMEANSAAYAPVLGVDETPAVRAREAGAIAAGISGTGPAIIALVRPPHIEPVRKALEESASDVRVVRLNTVESPEVVV